jgi:hypothetical protein
LQQHSTQCLDNPRDPTRLYGRTHGRNRSQFPQGTKCTNTFTVHAPDNPRDPTSVYGRTHSRNRFQLAQKTKCTNTCTVHAPDNPRDPTSLYGRTYHRRRYYLGMGVTIVGVIGVGLHIYVSGRFSTMPTPTLTPQPTSTPT